MATSAATTVLHFLRHVITLRAADASSDGELVQRYARQRDEEAFTELLRRHGPMVLGVCRRLLSNSADADDAFQATFLVLVRKAGSLGRPASVAAWLHGVACRTALKVRGEAAKRSLREREAAAMSASCATDESIWHDFRPLLDEEIARLPVRYRVPFVLCHLEGKTNEEAARQLDCPKGTVLSRLSRARERLRARLTKRGITLSAAALAALVTGPELCASVPTVLAQATTQAAAAFAAGGMIAAPLLTLTEGVLHAMFAAKLKFAATVLFGVTLITGAGTYGFARLSSGQGLDQNDGNSARSGSGEKDGPHTPRDPRIKRDRLAAQRDTYREQWNARRKDLLEGKTTVKLISEANRFLGQAELSLSNNSKERITAIEGMIERAKTVERIIQERVEAGVTDQGELKLAKGWVVISQGVLKDEIKPNKKMMELTQKLLEAAKQLWWARSEEFLAGKSTASGPLSASQWITKAQQEMTDSMADHLRILEGQVDRTKMLHEILQDSYKAGKTSIGEVAEAACARHDAEIALERFKAKLPKDGVKGEVTKALFEGIEVNRQP